MTTYTRELFSLSSFIFVENRESLVRKENYTFVLGSKTPFCEIKKLKVRHAISRLLSKRRNIQYRFTNKKKTSVSFRRFTTQYDFYFMKKKIFFFFKRNTNFHFL